MDATSTALDVALPNAALFLARRFARGATMWCISPRWPEHGRHLAVEFVHPVVVGSRALPAVSVAGSDPVAFVRAAARPGDVAVVVSTTDDVVVAELFARAPAWGVSTVWLASGSPTDAARADPAIEPHPDLAIRVDDPAGTAAFDGSFVLRYHLLWELTQVCFEHPGLLVEAEPESDLDVCTVCRDEGRLAEVIGPGTDGDVQVRTAQGRESVDISLVGDVARDDLVLVHAGAAIARVGVP